MKVNLPVTQEELLLEPGKPIVTKTNLKGQIIYVNDSFVRISGFTREELLGASHNIVRHPDMPPGAFEDMWRCLKANMPWRGIVKNRAKDGAYYWVDAFVTPITEQGRPVGYISVRSAPSRAQIAATETLLRDVREKRATYPATPTSLGTNRAKQQLYALNALPAVLAIVGAWWGGTGGVALASLAAVAIAAQVIVTERVIFKPLKVLQHSLRAIDEGRLNESVPIKQGPLARLFLQAETLRIHLQATFCDVMLSTDTVAQGAQALTTEMHRMVETTQLQGKELCDVAASVEEMSVTVSEISESTAHTQLAAESTQQLAEQGQEAVERQIDGGRDLIDKVKTSQAQIQRVNASINEISSIAKLINEIAEQTNLLALNAAIEAARAGEQGRGFAVVADEVRKLAENTASSTRSIAGTIDAVRASASEAVQSMERVVADVESNTQEIEAMGQRLSSIVSASQNAETMSQSVKDMLVQQNTASQQISNTMERISASVESNNTAISGVEQSTQTLSHTSAELRRLVEHMRSALT